MRLGAGDSQNAFPLYDAGTGGQEHGLNFSQLTQFSPTPSPVVLYSSSGASKFFSTIMKRNIATKSCMNFVIATKPIEGEYNIPLDCQI